MIDASGPSGAGRRHYYDLDALRGILMSLGVVLHAADVYAAGKPWLVNDPQGCAFFASLSLWLHVIRIPAFFIISGFFSRLLLHRRGAAFFLCQRGIRLLVPLASAAVLLNAAQAYLLAAWGRAPLSDYYQRGGCVSHLWFLLDLLVYTLVAAGAWPLLRSIRSERMPLWGGAVVLLLPFTTLAARGLARFCPAHGTVASELLDFGELLHHFPFFVFGALYQPGRDDARLRQMARGALLLLPLAALGKLVSTGRGVELFCYSAGEWSIALLCLYLARRYLDGRSRAFRGLAEASYTVYLVHHLLVVAAGLALLSVPLYAGVKFLLVVAVVFPLSLGAHFFLIRPNPLLRFLFNGKGLEGTRLPQLSGSLPRISEVGTANRTGSTKAAAMNH